VTLTFGPLILKVRDTSSDMWSMSVRNLSNLQLNYRYWWSHNVIAHVSAHCDLWPLDLELLWHFECHKIWAKSNNLRPS